MSNARKQNEIAFHDRLFGAKDDPRNAIAKYYRVSDATHSLYREVVADHCRGRRLLEYGCGTGDDSLFWAQSGARVTGIDISSEAIKKARENARREGATIAYHVMDAEDLRFEDDSFDVVVGNGILHHLNPDTSLRELSRILRRNGHAIFIEPMGHNALINLYRRRTPALRTEDEHPLRMEDLQLARRYFHDVDATFFNLFTLLAVPFRNLPGFNVLVNLLNVVDRMAFQIFPFTKKYAWMVVLHASKPNKMSDQPVRHGLPAAE
jgi:ubiquinone/menaquinone biosynthesis C-methylase UbiE